MTTYPDKYLDLSTNQTKRLGLVMEIEGVSEIFGIAATYQTIKYGDPDIFYGDPGLIYGALKRIDSVRDWIMLEGGLTLSQRIEPEQGRASVGSLSLDLIDKNGEVSRIIAPGVIYDEVMGKREVRVWTGYQGLAWPDDWVCSFRGYITGLSCLPGRVKFQLSDSTSKKRQPIANQGATRLSSSVNASQTTWPVDNTAGFYQKILGPSGGYDSAVRTYVSCESEWAEYGSSGLAPTVVTLLGRGSSFSLGSTPAAHSADQKVGNGIQLTDNFLTLAMKVMLSGWGGPCETGVEIESFVYTDLIIGNTSNALVLTRKDAFRDYGLTIGDYVNVSGSTNPSNDGACRVVGFGSRSGFSNDIILTDKTFTFEQNSPAVCSLRSKYDTLPVSFGLKMRMRDVDVETIELIRSRYFATGSDVRLFYKDPIDGKKVIDTDLMLPFGCYSISRFGRASVSVTRPPTPLTRKTLELNATNIIEPDKIEVQRSMTSRRFFNLISYQFDKNVLDGSYASIQYNLDTASLNLFQQVNKLPISADGLYTDLGGATVAQRRGIALLKRYKKVALEIKLKVQWSVGCQIEVSDIVILKDNGQLKIMNFETGERDLGTQFLEVIDRSMDIKGGFVNLVLLGGLGFRVTDRFGLISPSSEVGVSSTSTAVNILPSFGSPNLSEEVSKWSSFVGLPVHVHSRDYVNSATANITDVSVGGTLTLDPPLSYTPASGDIVDIANYPTSTDVNELKTFKSLYSYITPTVSVIGVPASGQYQVPSGSGSLFTIGNQVIVRSQNFSDISDELTVTGVTGDIISASGSLSFTPATGYVLEGIGFHDGGGFYRFS